MGSKRSLSISEFLNKVGYEKRNRACGSISFFQDRLLSEEISRPQCQAAEVDFFADGCAIGCHVAEAIDEIGFGEYFQPGVYFLSEADAEVQTEARMRFEGRQGAGIIALTLVPGIGVEYDAGLNAGPAALLLFPFVADEQGDVQAINMGIGRRRNAVGSEALIYPRIENTGRG